MWKHEQLKQMDQSSTLLISANVNIKDIGWITLFQVETVLVTIMFFVKISFS